MASHCDKNGKNQNTTVRLLAFLVDTRSLIDSQQAVIRASPIDRRQYFHWPNSQRNLINEWNIHFGLNHHLNRPHHHLDDQLHCLRLFIAKLHQRNLSSKRAKIYLCALTHFPLTVVVKCVSYSRHTDDDARETRVSSHTFSFISSFSPTFFAIRVSDAQTAIWCAWMCRCKCVKQRRVYHYHFITIIIYIKWNCCDSDTERFSDRLNRLHESKTRFATTTKKSEDKVSSILFSTFPRSVFFYFFSSFRHRLAKKKKRAKTIFNGGSSARCERFDACDNKWNRSRARVFAASRRISNVSPNSSASHIRW